MIFGFWSWVPVVIIVFLIFYANRLPEMRKQAEEKLKEGKALLEKGKKELEAKANDVKQKAKEKQEAREKEKAEKEKVQKAMELDADEAISEEDLAFMPTQEKSKKEDK